jgi:NADPH-dependent glutamate synthase beta subunit-like oxidoreductase/2,4-dienoyl-CoA reductase-like NADH-dependent reductase (Old Yellow Enzyme family)
MPAHEQFHFSSLDQLRQKIEELALHIGVADDISPLLQPLKVGEFTVPNRLVVLPMEGCDGTAEGAPDTLTYRRYQRFAAGGAGLLWFEATAVVPEGRANPRQLWIRERNVADYAEMIRRTHAAAQETMGPSHRPLTILQLTHSGRYSRPVRAPHPIIAHHSPFLDPIHRLPADYPLITDEELERLEDRYVEAALCAQRAGFDGVDVKACHRYLVSELLASHTRENSRYGGPLENRTRFMRNVVAKIRAAAPGLIVTSRMNAYDAMAHPYGFGVAPWDPSTPALAEPIELIGQLKAAGYPLINITVGNPYFNPHVNRPFDLPVSGAPIPPENPLEGVARFVGIVHRIQSEHPDLPVIGGGYSWLRQFLPNVGAAHVRNGWVSLVGMGRLAFAYPNAPRDLMEKGKLDPEKVCVACSACTQIMRDGGRAGCVPRDAEVYEPIYKQGRAEALDTIQAMAQTCRQCNDPNCVSHCPAQVNIPKFVNEIATGQFREAYETIRKSNVLAAVCGYVCPSETLCESACINQYYTDTVPIRHLQRWVSRKAVEEGWAAEPRAHAGKTGKRVAVLGAGPAGVAAAVKLAQLGHSVTLLDRSLKPGGMAQETIPPDRLPDPIIAREIQSAIESSGDLIQIRTAALGPECTLDNILAEGHQSVLIAFGLGASSGLPNAQRPAEGVLGALEFLETAKAGGGDLAGKTVLVLGAGNTAIDSALTAKRLGARDVAIVYRRSFAEMPAWPQERDEAVRAGIHFLILTQPVEYVTGEDGNLTGLKVVRTQLGPAGPDGRRQPKDMPGTEHVLPADVVVEALGQRVEEDVQAALPGVEFTRGGRVVTAAGSLSTTRAGVFAAGDIVNGGTTVVQAVAEGARAAREIHQYLRD